jgi:hypothetical protein
MQNELILVLGQCGVIAALGIVGALFLRKTFNHRWFIGALLLYVLYDFLLTRGFYLIPNPLAGAHWNWFGKALSFGGMLVIASLPRFGFKRVGLTLRQAPGSKPAFLVFAAVIAYFFYVAIGGADGQTENIETIAFQWTMPGLDEELFFTGVFFLAMNEAFTARVNIFGARIGYGAFPSGVLFGLIHAMDYNVRGFSFNIATFAAVTWTSPLVLWMRVRTGSLLLPVLGHNFANGASTLF